LTAESKGRVERLFGTLQDRLVIELRLAGASTREQANAHVTDYLPRFNAQFAVPAAQEGTAYRALPATFKPEQVYCFKYERVVAADNTVQFGEQRIQVLPGKERRSYARSTVQVHERFDGSLAIYYAGVCLASTQAPLEAPQLRSRGGRLRLPAASAPAESPTNEASPGREPTRASKPRDDHPWRTWTGPPDLAKQADPS
jgi:hypothetical protein